MYKTKIFNLSLFKKIFLYELSFDKKIYFHLKLGTFLLIYLIKMKRLASIKILIIKI